MSSVKIIGLDILPGTSASGKGNKKSKFAAVVLSSKRTENNDQLISDITINDEIPELSFFDVLNLVRREKADVLAFDNIFEIVQDSKEIKDLARKIPFTSIVQVTGSPNTGYQKLNHLSQSQSLWDKSQGKPNSIQSAELISRLAFAGIGYKIVPFEDELKITISKRRNIGKGGWSAPRYERNMKIAVKNVTNEFKERLNVLEVDYDEFEYPKRSVLVVHPTRQKQPISLSQLVAIAKKISNDLAKAHVSRIPKSSLEFIPLSGQAPSKIPSKKILSVVVGVDPGTTTGLAIIDVISGNLLTLLSAREFSTSKIVRTVTKNRGKTVLICSDVRKPVPHLVQKLKKIFNAQLFAPSNPNTPRSEKRAITQSYLDSIDRGEERTDNHQRDALFAAIKGYNSIKRHIDKIKSSIEDKPVLIPKFNNIVDQVLSGISVHDAIAITEAQVTADALKDKIKSRTETSSEIQISQEITNQIEGQNQRINELRLSIRLLESEKSSFLDENKRLNKLNIDLGNKLNKIKRKKSFSLDLDHRVEEKNRDIRLLANKIGQKDNDLKNAQETIEKLKKIRLIWQRGNRVPLKPIQKLHEEIIIETDKEIGIRPGDILLLLDPSGGSSSTAKWLIDRKIRAIIVPKGYLRRLSSLATKAFENDEIPLFEEELLHYDPEKPVKTRKNKIIFYEGLYIINKSYLLQRIYEQELNYLKKREERRIKRYREDRIPEIPVNKHQLELLLEKYQERRLRELWAKRKHKLDQFEDYEDEDL
ncbi:MAG: DUF460 domain-containing protein [Candidatus Hodarchaeales archaeon]|jgi:predicted RNase H-like nuclease (RuvC/YqgF family)